MPCVRATTLTNTAGLGHMYPFMYMKSDADHGIVEIV